MGHPARHPFLLPAVLLGLVTIAFAAPLCFRCLLPAEIDYNEGWNAIRQQQAWTLHALYGHAPDLSVTNYPPLSFHIVGALAWLGADVILAGRILSLLAIAAIAVILARIAHCITGSRALAACSGFGWIANLELWTPGRIGTNDPQLLGMAFEIAAFSIFLRRRGRNDLLVLAAMLVVFGVFIKHNLIALPIGMTCCLLARHAWRSLAIWIGVGASLSAAMAGLTLAWDGQLFFAHLLDPRLFDPAHALRLSLSYAMLSFPSLAVAGWWAWHRRGSVSAQPLIFAWLASLTEIAVFAGGDGVGKSIFQDSLMLTALAQPLALRWIAARCRPGCAALAPCLLLLSPLMLAAGIGQVWAQASASERQIPDLDRATAILKSAPGAIVCEDLAMCFHAGRASSFDAYYVLDQIGSGRIPTTRIDDLAKFRRLAAVEIGTADDPYTPGHLPARFSPSFMAELAANYRSVFKGAAFSIYVPVASSAGR